MPRARLHEVEIEYDTFGDPRGRPLVLVMGLGAQMILWDEGFCRDLAARGHFVVRFDNRDVGLSTKLDHLGEPDLFAVMGALMSGVGVTAPYGISEMAGDVVGLLDALELDSVHLVGASLGGMIAQTVAIEAPERVRSLTSMLSSTGDPDLPAARSDAAAALLAPRPADLEGNVDRVVALFRVIGSPGFPFDEAWIRERETRAFARGHHPAGSMRQLVALLTATSRSEDLGTLRVPALVVHGDADPLVPLEAGMATARAIPGAELMIVEGMGHDFPRPVWPRLVEAVSRLTESAEAMRREQRSSAG